MHTILIQICVTKKSNYVYKMKKQERALNEPSARQIKIIDKTITAE